MKQCLKHIAIIPDGNRRWSNANNISLERTYFLGSEKMMLFCETLFESYSTLEELTIFFVSFENLKNRRSHELDPLFKAGYNFTKLFYSSSKMKHIDLQWIGLYDHDFKVDSLLYENFIEHIMNFKEKASSIRKVNILIGYDVCRDIEIAISKDNNFNYANLEVNKQVDLIVRSGGRRRLSGFLPLMCQYSECAFINKYFLEIEVDDLMEYISNFHSIDRNIGR